MEFFAFRVDIKYLLQLILFAGVRVHVIVFVLCDNIKRASHIISGVGNKFTFTCTWTFSMLTQPKMNNVSLSESAISRCDNLGHYSKRETGDALPLFAPFYIASFFLLLWHLFIPFFTLSLQIMCARKH